MFILLPTMQKMHHSILITSCLMQAFVQIIFFTCQKRPALRPRFPNFDARSTVASCGSNSPVGSIFFAASNYNYRQLNLLFEAFSVHELIFQKLDHRRNMLRITSISVLKKFYTKINYGNPHKPFYQKKHET